jgi:hypothetical protein
VAADLEPLPPGWEPHHGLSAQPDPDGAPPDGDGAPQHADGPPPDRDGPAPRRPGDPAGQAPAVRHRRLTRRGRRRLVAAVLVAGGVVAAVAVAQNALDRRATRRAVAVLDAYEGGNYLLNVSSVSALHTMVPDDQAAVDAGLARADRAEAAGYGRLERDLESSPFLDGSTRHLVASVRGLLRSRVADLDALAAWRLRPAASRGPQPADPSPASNAASRRALGAAARHAGHPTPLPSAPLPSLGVDLTRWSDAPTRTWLAVGDSEAVQLVHVDASSSFDLQLTGTSGAVVARAGYVAAVTPSGAAVAKAPAVPGTVTELGLAGQILPAIEPDAVWLVASGPDDTATGRPTTTVTEVDGNGRRIAGPALIPNTGDVTGGVTGDGLVIDGGGGRLAVWDPATGLQRVVTAVPATLLAASADRLAWQPDDNGVVEVTELRTGATTTVTLPPGNVILPATDVDATTCAFSPDGGRLACPVAVLSSGGLISGPPDADPYHLAVIGLGNGSVQVSPGAVGRADPHPLVWGADGSRLWTIVTTDQGSLLASWANGTPSAHELRFHAEHMLTGLAVVAG